MQRLTHFTRHRLIMTLMLTLPLGACTLSPKSLGTSGTSNLPEIRIGIVGTSAGPTGLAGSYSGSGAQLAIDQIDDAGGVRWNGKVYQLSLAFGGGDVQAQVANVAFTTPPVVAMLGPDENDAALSALHLTGDAHLPQLTLATASALTDPTQNQQHEALFRVRPPESYQARVLTQYAAHLTEAKAIAIVTIDTPYGADGGVRVRSTLADLGITPVTQISLSPGLVDAAPAAEKIIAAHADTLICWCVEVEAAQLIQGLRSAGWQGSFLMSAADADFIALAGSAGEGVIGLESWLPTATDTKSQDFVKHYRARFGKIPDERSAAMYDAVYLLAQAITAVGPDRAAIAGYLTQIKDFGGVTGMYDGPRATDLLHTRGDLTTALTIVRIEQGHPVAITTMP